MAKRGATSNLNQDNWDVEEPQEEAGTFQKASDDVIQKRTFKVAKRRSAGLSDSVIIIVIEINIIINCSVMLL